MRSFLAGSVMLLLCAAGCGAVDTSGAIDGPGEAPADCDGDSDTYIHPHPSCDAERAGAPADCDDTRGDVHPGATVVCGDGVVNDCNVLGADVIAALGVEEVGKVGEQAVYRTDPDGFLNNVAIAAEAGTATTPALALMAGSESATTVRLMRTEIGNPASAASIPVTFPSGYRFANHNVDLRRISAGQFEIATVGLDTANRLTPMFGRFAPTDAAVALRPVVLPTMCPAGTNDYPVVLHGLDEAGHFYFELIAGTPPVIYGVAADASVATCRPLTEVGANVEFGSQIVATGTMAVGRTDMGLWMWEGPLNYNDLHPYTTSGSVNGTHTALARNTQAAEPVLLAYRSASNLMIEAVQCTGLFPCTRIAATPVAVDNIRDLVFAPIASGAALIQTRGDFSGPQEFVAQLVDANGGLLGGGVTIALGGTTRDFRQLDAFTVPPGIGREYYDVFVGYAASDSLAMQTEMTVMGMRACQAR